MTKREFFETIVKLSAAEEVGADMMDKLGDFAANEIVKLDAANAKRRETVSKKAQENAPLLDKIANDLLTDEPQTATMIGELMEVSTQKASSLLRKLVEEGRAEVQDVKIPKKGTQKGYTAIGC